MVLTYIWSLDENLGLMKIPKYVTREMSTSTEQQSSCYIKHWGVIAVLALITLFHLYISLQTQGSSSR